jgi:hypothetical protein
VSVKSRKAGPVIGYEVSVSQTDRFISLTLVLVTIVAEQGSAIVRIKLEGVTRLAEEYTTLSTVTYST